MRTLRHIVLLIVVVAGCRSTDDTMGTLSKYKVGYDGTKPVHLGPISDPNQVVALSKVSEALGCNLPCGKVGITSTGACISGIAVRCINGKVACDECHPVGKECLVAEHAVCRRACEGEQVCPATNECFTRVCCPNTTWCERGSMVLCNDSGTQTQSTPCLEGLDCHEGACRPARPYVLILFDTSGSMKLPVVAEGTSQSLPGWPACDNADDPVQRIGRSKIAFRTLFDSPAYNHVLFALQRFPQVLNTVGKPLCPGGGYATQKFVTGHDGVQYQIPDDDSGLWFSQNIGEVLVVGFPAVASNTNRGQLHAWMDFDSEIKTTEEVCDSHSMCPGGLCTVPGGEGVCRYFTNPELRPLGWTPLGTGLFYAGEYFRKFIVVDGTECVLDADCNSAAYHCIEGVCTDPNRQCRQRSIVVFTDGYDTTSPGLWMQPVVQAKRMRMGLDCNVDDDCGLGSVCATGGTCQLEEGPHNPCAEFGLNCDVEETQFAEAFSKNLNRLRDRNGLPIRITTHVVDATGATSPMTAELAAYGGGMLVPVNLADSVNLLEGIQGVMDWKDLKLNCP